VNRRTGTVAALLFTLIVLAGASSGRAAQTPVPSHTLHVGITEWAVVPSQGMVFAGQVRLTVENDGRLRHELDIVRTLDWGEQLDVRNGRAVGQDATRPVVVAPGQARSVRVDLEPGFYVLLDNIRGHYDSGAAVSIFVT